MNSEPEDRAGAVVSLRKERTAEIIRALVQIGTDVLTSTRQMSDADARATMRNVANRLCGRFGGGYVYFPRDTAFLVFERDGLIFDSWRGGRTVRQLAVDHELTEARVYQIIERMRRDRPAG